MISTTTRHLLLFLAIVTLVARAPICAQTVLPYSSADTLLSRLIQHMSTNGHEGGVGRYISTVCEERGLFVERFSTEDSSYNFAASLYPLSEAKPNIILLSHLDVVAGGKPEGWQHGAFSGFIDSTHIHGRGAIDCKGLTVMQLEALLEVKQAAQYISLPYNITLLCVSGEENGGANGAQRVANQWLEKLHPYVVMGEGGSGLQNAIPNKPGVNLYAISVVEKDNFWLKLDISFKGHGHGATAPGNYANKAMLRALDKLTSVETPIEFTPTTRRMFRDFGNIVGGRTGFFIKHINWWIARPVLKRLVRNEPLLASLLTNTATLTQLSNPPGPVNQIPSSATAYLDCRLLPGTNRKRFISKLKYGFFTPQFDVTILNESAEAEETSIEHPFWGIITQTIKQLDPQASLLPTLFPAGTDNNFFRAKGIAVFGITPIVAKTSELEVIHNQGESIARNELRRGIRFYVRLLSLAEGMPNISLQASNVKVRQP